MAVSIHHCLGFSFSYVYICFLPIILAVTKYIFLRFIIRYKLVFFIYCFLVSDISFNMIIKFPSDISIIRQNVDSGLDCGLDIYGLDCGLDFGLNSVPVLPFKEDCARWIAQ